MTLPSEKQYTAMRNVVSLAIQDYINKFRGIPGPNEYPVEINQLIVFLENFRINTITHTLLVGSVLDDVVTKLQSNSVLISKILEITQLVRGRCTTESGDLDFWSNVAAYSVDNSLYQNESSLLNKLMVSGLSSNRVEEAKKVFDHNQWLLVLFLICLFDIVIASI